MQCGAAQCLVNPSVLEARALITQLLLQHLIHRAIYNQFSISYSALIEYSAISYNGRDKEMIVNYIRNQKEHHKIVGFEEEYRAFLIENSIEIKEE